MGNKEKQVLAIGGGALLLFAMMGKKSRGASASSGAGSGAGGGAAGGGATVLPLPGFIEGPVPEMGPPPFGNACKGPKSGGSFEYDREYWGESGEGTSEKILKAFSALGYNVDVNPLGPDMNMAKVGVKGDAIENQPTMDFQSHYNKVSVDRGGDIGGLDPEGKIGPCVVTALKFLLDEGFNAASWSAAVNA